MKTRYADIPAYVTKDGSVIRELLHPEFCDAFDQLHRHRFGERKADSAFAHFVVCKFLLELRANASPKG